MEVWLKHWRCPPKNGWWFQIYLFSSLFGEDFHFDKYFSKGLKPPSRKTNMTMEKTTMNEDISPEMQMVIFFNVMLVFKGGVKKRLEHGGKMYWKIFRSWRVGLQFFLDGCKTSGIKLNPNLRMGSSVFFAAIMVKLGYINSSQAFSQRGAPNLCECSLSCVNSCGCCMLMESLSIYNPPIFSKTERSTCTFCVHPLQFGDKHDYKLHRC